MILWIGLWIGIFKPPFRKSLGMMAGSTGLEPAASAVTGQRSNQLNYDPACAVVAPLWGASLARHPVCVTSGGQCRTRTCDLLLVRQAL